jgi:hypothetical protein
MRKNIGQLIMGVALSMFASSAHATPYDVYALADSYNNGTGSGLSTISLITGQAFTITVDSGDLWNAGLLPRWSNADGLIVDLYATGTDESGQIVGTHIGQPYGLLTSGIFSAPYGALVGQIDSGSFFLVGTNYSGIAPISGTLKLFYWDDYTPDNTQFITADININPVPEPATMMLFGLGITGFAVIGRRLKK